MIRVEVEVTHNHGTVKIVEVEPTSPESEEHAKALIEMATNRAKKRITCAVIAKDNA